MSIALIWDGWQKLGARRVGMPIVVARMGGTRIGAGSPQGRMDVDRSWGSAGSGGPAGAVGGTRIGALGVTRIGECRSRHRDRPQGPDTTSGALCRAQVLSVGRRSSPNVHPGPGGLCVGARHSLCQGRRSSLNALCVGRGGRCVGARHRAPGPERPGPERPPGQRAPGPDGPDTESVTDTDPDRAMGPDRGARHRAPGSAPGPDLLLIAFVSPSMRAPLKSCL